MLSCLRYTATGAALLLVLALGAGEGWHWPQARRGLTAASTLRDEGKSTRTTSSNPLVEQHSGGLAGQGASVRGVSRRAARSGSAQRQRQAELPDVTSRPIVCVLTQPGDLAKPGESYLSAGYVKWLEAAGARVAPVFYDYDSDEVTELFNMCNAVLFPGGNYPLGTGTTWFKTAELLFDLAVEANKAGESVPLLGTCLGLQLLVTIITRDQYALVPLDAANRPHQLQWTAQVSQSRFLAGLPEWVRESMAQLPIAMHNHHFGLVDDSFERYPELRKSFEVLAYSQDWQNTTYVSIVEHLDFPFIGLAFHNEKVPYEWTLDIDIPHTREATDASYMMGQAFVSLARKNGHRGEDVVAEDKRLIYNWAPRFMGKHNSPDQADQADFEQVYIFKNRCADRPGSGVAAAQLGAAAS